MVGLLAPRLDAHEAGMAAMQAKQNTQQMYSDVLGKANEVVLQQLDQCQYIRFDFHQ